MKTSMTLDRSADRRVRAFNVAAGVSPAVEGGILPPGPGFGESTTPEFITRVPPGRMPGSTAGGTPAATNGRADSAVRAPRILRATHLGMCFGVRDAIALATRAAAEQPVTILGDLVHNETVLNDLSAQGIRFASTPGESPTNTVMITAHGTSDRARGELRAQGFNVIDSTCPLVHHAHRALRELVRDGFHPVVIGKRDHVEVRGLTGDFDGCDVVLSEDDIAKLQPRARFGVVSQTTQPIERVRQLVAFMRRQFPESEIHFRDTVCQPTKQRQSAAVELARQCDVVIVIGGAHSNNTRELVATCSRHCLRVHHVQHAADLRVEWLENATTVGLTAGTSTPDSVIDAVEHALQLGQASRLPQLSVSPVCVL